MIAYVDMPSGISGDMFLGCLVDAGWPLKELQKIPQRLGLPEEACAISSQEVMRGALRATSVSVGATETHTHRHLSHIEEMIGSAALSQAVKDRATAVFRRLARAEARVHGTTVEQIHFHEVGAVDAIVDIVGVCVGLDALAIDRLYASSFPLGGGWTNSAHGKIPLPAPATLELLAEAKAPVRPAPGPAELVTPTGAALLCELAEFRQPVLRLTRIAIGAGGKEFEWPNVARIWLGDDDKDDNDFAVLETNIDDMNPELYQPVRDALMRGGALDVWTTPVQMKKGRPGSVLSVLAPLELEQTLSEKMIQETTTLGVRAHRVHRYEARRTFQTIETSYGPVRIKLKWASGMLLGVKPEYEDCVRLAAERDVPARMVVDHAYSIAHSQFGSEVVDDEQ